MARAGDPPSPDDLSAAYGRLKAAKGSWRFEHPDDCRDIATLASAFAERVDLGYSPHCEPNRNARARYWCLIELGDLAIRYERWSNFRIVDGKPRLGFDYHWNPEGRWLIVRRTYLFRDPSEAVWFKMLWW